MGFGSFADDIDESSSGSSSSSSSSSTSGSSKTTTTGLSIPRGTEGDDFPVYSKAKPYAVIVEQSNGFAPAGLSFEANAVPAVEMKKDWYSAPWVYADSKPQEWKKVWWSQAEFRRTAFIVDKVTGYDLRSLLTDDVSRALDIIHEASNKYTPEGDQEWSHTRRCAVCDSTLMVKSSEYETVKNKPVCSHHSIEEVMKAGIVNE